jgi:hypothetical protein
MTQTGTTVHTTKIITVCNGGGKARRAVCSCGYLGVRFAYLPATAKVASGKAQREADLHAAGDVNYR